MVTSGGQAELGRALGGYVNVVTKSGTNTSHGDVYGYFRDDRFNAPNALSGTTLPMNQKQYGASLGGPIAPQPDVLLRQLRAAAAGSDRPRHDLARERQRHQRAAGRGRLSGVAGHDRHLSEPGRQHERPRQGRSPVQRHAISSASATACTTSRLEQLARRRRLNAPSAPRRGSTTSTRRSRSATR